MKNSRTFLLRLICLSSLMGSSTALAGWEPIYSEGLDKTSYMFIEPNGNAASNQQGISNPARSYYMTSTEANKVAPLLNSDGENCSVRLKLTRSESSTTSPSRPTVYYAYPSGTEFPVDSDGGKMAHIRFSIPEYRGNDFKASLSIYRGPTPTGVQTGRPGIHVVMPLPYYLAEMTAIRNSDLATRTAAAYSLVKKRFGDSYEIQMNCTGNTY